MLRYLQKYLPTFIELGTFLYYPYIKKSGGNLMCVPDNVYGKGGHQELARVQLLQGQEHVVLPELKGVSTQKKSRYRG